MKHDSLPGSLIYSCASDSIKPSCPVKTMNLLSYLKHTVSGKPSLLTSTMATVMAKQLSNIYRQKVKNTRADRTYGWEEINTECWEYCQQLMNNSQTYRYP